MADLPDGPQVADHGVRPEAGLDFVPHPHVDQLEMVGQSPGFPPTESVSSEPEEEVLCTFI